MIRGEAIRQYKAFQDALKKNPYDEATHLAFADFLEENGIDDEAEYHRIWTRDKQEAIDTLREVAHSIRMSFEELLEEGDEIATGEYCFGNDDGPEEMRYLWRDFLEAWRTYTGKKVKDIPVDQTHFRCGC